MGIGGMNRDQRKREEPGVCLTLTVCCAQHTSWVWPNEIQQTNFASVQHVGCTPTMCRTLAQILTNQVTCRPCLRNQSLMETVYLILYQTELEQCSKRKLNCRSFQEREREHTHGGVRKSRISAGPWLPAWSQPPGAFSRATDGEQRARTPVL